MSIIYNIIDFFYDVGTLIIQFADRLNKPKVAFNLIGSVSTM